jgi:putative ABC transport system permease protein
MIKNFLLVAIRNFLKQRIQSVLNVIGLAIGLACAMFVFLYVHDELTYDTQHPDADNTYRIISKYKNENGVEDVGGFGAMGWAHYLKENFGGIKKYAMIERWGWPFSIYAPTRNGEDRILLSEDVSIVSKNYPALFYLDLIEGDKSTIFNEPTDIIISETAAHELFGAESALEKQIQINHPFFSSNKKIDVVVKGVFRDLPYNMQFGRSTKVMLNVELQRPRFEADKMNFDDAMTALVWPSVGGNIYIQADQEADLKSMAKQLIKEVNKAMKAKEYEGTLIDIVFLKIEDTHFSEIPNLTWPDMGGNKQYVYIFITIGIFILLISCINYTNLATARSTRRNKEVGMRKALGSSRGQLVFQFLQESFLMTGIAIVAAFILVIAFLPKFSAFANKDLTIGDLFGPVSLLTIMLLWIVVSLLSGLYPAFYISSFNAIKTLKGSAGSGKSGNRLRQALMVFQFATSLTLIIFTWVVIRQMSDMINNDLNKTGDQVLSIRYGNSAPVNKLEVLKNELAKDPDLANSSYGNHLPRRDGFTPLDYEVTLPQKDDKKYRWEMMCVGPGFPELYGLELVTGKMFESVPPIDSTGVLVNEEVARQLNTSVDELIGQTFIMKDEWNNKEKNYTIKGVIKDFKYKSAYKKIDPLVLSIQMDRGNDIIYYVKLPAGKIQEKIASVEKTWKKVMPEGVGMAHWFVDDEFNRLYYEENALYDLSRVFTVLGIITTCIGLLGMAMFMAEKRSKEMAIRKVMGASSANVFSLMMVSFFKLMGVACIIGLPVAYFVSDGWLKSFIYKIELNWLIFAGSLSLILSITIFTISFHSIKLATSNPVDPLKQE